MDWSVFAYFLAAVGAAGIGYVFWPKDHWQPLNALQEPLSGEPPHEDPMRSAA